MTTFNQFTEVDRIFDELNEPGLINKDKVSDIIRTVSQSETFRSINKDEIDSLFKDLDKNNEGKVDKNQLRRYIWDHFRNTENKTTT